MPRTIPYAGYLFLDALVWQRNNRYISRKYRVKIITGKINNPQPKTILSGIVPSLFFWVFIIYKINNEAIFTKLIYLTFLCQYYTSPAIIGTENITNMLYRYRNRGVWYPPSSPAFFLISLAGGITPGLLCQNSSNIISLVDKA